MEKASGWLKSAIKLWFTYLIGFIVLAIFIIVGGFVLFRPYIDSFVSSEIKKHGIQAQSANTQLSGRVHMMNVRVPTPAGFSMTIGELTVRPPFSIFPGAATLYNVDIKRENIHIHIPEISLGGLKIAEKDRNQSSHILELLNRASVSSIYAGQAELSNQKPDGTIEKTTIKGFSLHGYKHGAIGSISVDSLESNLTINVKSSLNGAVPPTRIAAKADGLSASGIDLAYGYQIFSGRAQNFDHGQPILGPLNFKNVTLEVFKGKENVIGLKVGSFASTGLAIRPQRRVPEEAVKAIFEARKSGNDEQAQKDAKTLAFSFLQSISAFDADVTQAELKTEKFKTQLSSLNIHPKNWTSLIPDELMVSITGLNIDTNLVGGEKAEFIHNVGYQTITLNGKIDYEYQPKTKVLLLKAFDFYADNAANEKFSAKLINVDERIFNGDKTIINAALTKVALINFALQYSDFGLIDHLMQALSIIAGVEKQDVYMVLDTMVADLPRLFTNDVEKQQLYLTELKKFAKDRKTIVINGRAKNPNGLTQADLDDYSGDGTTDLLQKLDLQIRSSSE